MKKYLKIFSLIVVFVFLYGYAGSLEKQRHYLDLNVSNAENATRSNKTSSSIKKYTAKRHSKSVEGCEKLSFKDEEDNEDIYRTGDKCFYKEHLLESYQKYRERNIGNEAGKHLRKTIIKGSNHHDIIEKGYLEISYTWANNQRLEVKLFFSGGITTLLFEENNNGTEVSIISDAD